MIKCGDANKEGWQVAMRARGGAIQRTTFVPGDVPGDGNPTSDLICARQRARRHDQEWRREQGGGASGNTNKEGGQSNE